MRQLAARDPRSWVVVFVVLLAVALGYQAPPLANPRDALPTYAGVADDSPDDPPDARPLNILCAELNGAWGSDWPAVIRTLRAVKARGEQCGAQDPYLLLYPAYFNYGAALERTGNLQGAISAYRDALQIQPEGKEAALALRKHNALPPKTLATCGVTQIAQAWATTPLYQPQMVGDYVSLKDGAFVVNDQRYIVRGVNYYPARGPWRRFLTEWDDANVTRELDLIAGAGFNTIRIFLWYEALFDCEGNGAIPNPEAFKRLDTVIRLAAARGLRLIVTLNDLPDLLLRPLYRNPQPATDQTLFIVRRYRDEPAILAWDLRNEGDIDWIRGDATMREVLDWLRALSPQVRAADPHHLITAGWNEHAQFTDSAVDFLSLHHWRTPENLTGRVAALRSLSQKPILLEEIGYSSYGATYDRQAAQFRDTLTAAEKSSLLGWLVWTAFDFPTSATCIPPACPGKENSENNFGLWRADYSPKPALAVIRQIIGQTTP